MKVFLLILSLTSIMHYTASGAEESGSHFCYSLEDSLAVSKPKVIFYRNGDFGGSFVKYHLSDPDTIGFIKPKTFIIKEYNQGIYAFVAPELWKDTVYFEFKNGQNYIFEFVPSTMYTIKLPKMMKIRSGEEIKRLYSRNRYFRESFIKSGFDLADFVK